MADIFAHMNGEQPRLMVMHKQANGLGVITPLDTVMLPALYQQKLAEIVAILKGYEIHTITPGPDYDMGISAAANLERARMRERLRDDAPPPYKP